MKIINTLSIAILFSLSSCGSNNKIKPLESKRLPFEVSEDAMIINVKPGAKAQELSTREFDLVKIPEITYYENLMIKELESSSNANSISKKSLVQHVWLNFNGATVDKGLKNDQSFLVCSAFALIPEAKFSAEEKLEILAKVKRNFENTNIEFSITRPVTADFTTVHIGGTSTSLGCDKGDKYVASVLDLKNVNKSDTSFVFSANLTELSTVSVYISRALGFSFGLRLDDNAESIMYALLEPELISNQTSFKDASLFVSKTKRQNSKKLLIEMFSKIENFEQIIKNSENKILTVVKNFPKVYKNMPGLAQIGGLAKSLLTISNKTINDFISSVPNLETEINNVPKLKKIIAIVLMTGTQEKTAENNIVKDRGLFDFFFSSKQSEKYVFSTEHAARNLSLVNADTIKNVADIASILGFPQVGLIINLVQTIFTKGWPLLSDLIDSITGAGKKVLPIMPPLAGVDLSKLINVDGKLNNLTLIELVHSLNKTNDIIKVLYKSETRDALLDLVRTAYSQAFYKYDGFKK